MIKVAIRKEPNGSLYMDKYFFNRYNDSDLARYNYTKVEVPEKCFNDFTLNDFNSNLTFSVEKYTARKQKEVNANRVAELKQLLASYDYKTIKYMQGELSEEEFSKVKAQCKAWRDEINSLG